MPPPPTSPPPPDRILTHAVTPYDVPVVNPGERLDRVLHTLSEAEAVAVPVVHDGRIVGALTADALTRLAHLMAATRPGCAAAMPDGRIRGLR